MIGSKVQEEEPAWQLLMTLKDLVELVMSPTLTDESIGFLDSLTSEYRHRFTSVLPQANLIPKHHFVEHYPQLIKSFGPLVSLCKPANLTLFCDNRRFLGHFFFRFLYWVIHVNHRFEVI